MYDDEALIHRPKEGRRKLGVGKTLFDQMCAAGDLEVVQLGPRAVGVTTESLNRVAREGALKLAALRRKNRQKSAAHQP
jgi:hypothetical protein